MINGGFVFGAGGGFTVTISYVQIIMILLTIVLMIAFSYLIGRTALGRAQRACQQDLLMAGLCGVNVDRTISLTFVMGAALAAVAGLMATLYYGVIDFFIGFLAGVKAFTAAVLGGIGSIPGAMLGGLTLGLVEAFWSGYFSIEYKDVAAFAHPRAGPDLPADGPAWQARDREGLRRVAGRVIAEPAAAGARIDWPTALKEAGLAAFVALVLFLPLIGVQTVRAEGGLGLNFRFGWVLLGVALVAAGRSC